MPISDEIKKDMAKVQALKIDKVYRSFVYNKEYADILKIDKSKAIVMPKDMYAAGITIDEKKPETETRFAEYDIRLHLFVKHQDDYALPKGDFGDFRAYLKFNSELRDFAHSRELYQYQNVADEFSMKHFISNDDYDIKPIHDNDYINAGSAFLYRFYRNISPGVDYFEYHFFSDSMQKTALKQNTSIWIEKEGRPDFQYSSSGVQRAKDFYQFSIPKKLNENKCVFIQKIHMKRHWNSVFQMTESGYPEAIFLRNINDEFPC